jgi:hypothetical protein
MSADPLAKLKGLFQVEESRLNARHGSKIRAGLWTVRCPHCPTTWTLQVRENGETSPPIEVLLDHDRRHG